MAASIARASASRVNGFLRIRSRARLAKRHRTLPVCTKVDDPDPGLERTQILDDDSRGHLAGDALLRLAGETVRAHIRPSDVIVRYGGDEFVCAMSNLTALEARPRFVKSPKR